jgi:23S rRNA (uridine2552-2'-O)-methyltransferase
MAKFIKKVSGSNPSGRSRGKTIHVKSARGRKNSSTRWLQRQLNDPFVAEARRMGYRSRAAFKFIWIDDKYKFLKGVKRIVDLGSAPGGWTQIAVERLKKGAQIVAIDLIEMDPVQGSTFIQMDFMDEGAEEKLFEVLGGPVDLVMSDMANYATGHKATDQLRTMALCETAADFAIKVLAPKGKFVCKILQGGVEAGLMKVLKANFETVRHVKPDASRPESKEQYLLAIGFKGQNLFDKKYILCFEDMTSVWPIIKLTLSLIV